MQLKLFRLIHKDENIRVGAIVIGRQAEVVFPKPHQRCYVIVDGVKYVDFCGVSFICEIDEKTSKEYLEQIKKDIYAEEHIGRG